MRFNIIQLFFRLKNLLTDHFNSNSSLHSTNWIFLFFKFSLFGRVDFSSNHLLHLWLVKSIQLYTLIFFNYMSTMFNIHSFKLNYKFLIFIELILHCIGLIFFIQPCSNLHPASMSIWPILHSSLNFNLFISRWAMH